MMQWLIGERGKRDLLCCIFLIVGCLIFSLGCGRQDGTQGISLDKNTDSSSFVRGDQRIAQAFQTQTSGILVESSGIVEKILSDDLKGSRHQRFILRLSSGQTLLISHNIDLAPRIRDLNQGDWVVFQGEYEWNPQGGVVHWTHHDPQRRWIGGWLEHGGRRYE